MQFLIDRTACRRRDDRRPADTTNDVTARIARQSLERRGVDYASEVRRLLDAGLEVMRRCGTTTRPRVADIVAAAGLSNDAFYRHFPSKDALVAAILEDGTERLRSYLAHQMAKEATPEGQVRRWVEGVLSQAADEDIAATTLAVLWNGGSVGEGLPSGRPSASRPLATLLREPFAALGSADPELDAVAGRPRRRRHAVRPPVATGPTVPADDRPRRRRLPRRGHRVDEDAAMTFHLFLPQMRMPLDAMVERAQAAEAAGFEGMALMDHLAPPLAAQHDMWEAMTAATWLLARTETLVVGHLVLCDPLRHPAVLARQAATLDHASGGRYELGIGWGSVPDELDAFGVGADPARERVARLAESLDVMRALWTGEPVTYDGRFFRLHDAQQNPAPTRPIPIVVGGVGTRTLEVVRAPRRLVERADPVARPHRRARATGSGDARVSAQVDGGPGRRPRPTGPRSPISSPAASAAR